MEDLIVAFFTWAIVALIVFLIIRWFVLWYWRINEMADALHDQQETQQQILETLRGMDETLTEAFDLYLDDAEAKLAPMQEKEQAEQ